MQRRAPGRKLLIASLGVATASFGGACRNSVVANFPACDNCDIDESDATGSFAEADAATEAAALDASPGVAADAASADESAGSVDGSAPVDATLE